MEKSLYDEMDADTIAAEVMMLRAASTKAVVLVEGGDDEKVFVHLFDENNCDIVICHGHKNATEALNKLEKLNYLGVCCIVDADFSAFIGNPHRTRNLFQTDDHDLEVMLFKSKAFNRIISELGSKSKIQNLTKNGIDPREPIWKSAHVLGIFRLYSIQNNLNLKFKELSFKFIDRKSLSVDVDLMIKTVFNNSQKPLIDTKNIKDFIQQWVKKVHDHWQMCCGHDIATIFGKSLQSLLGSQDLTDGATIERHLRLGYSIDQFKNSLLYSKIQAWEQQNKTFRFLQN